MILICSGSGVKCKVKVIELKEGFQVQITGGNVKDVLEKENLKKCIEACCGGKISFRDISCR